jgi:predicted HNH restriction endonuclease
MGACGPRLIGDMLWWWTALHDTSGIPMPTISESDLVIPALELIAAHPQGIGTSRLSSLLRRQLKPTGDDLLILAGRGDDRFSQKVRNLKSHDTLERRGLARFVNGRYYIMPAGQVLASECRDILHSLRGQGFTERQRQNALDNKNYKDIMIEEGELTISNNAIARRSALLKRMAIKHFADRNGSIACAGCGFRAEAAYGPDAQGMIEIHHTKPLFLRGGVGVRTSITAALRHVAPLCPNCHRVVHMDRGTLYAHFGVKTTRVAAFASVDKAKCETRAHFAAARRVAPQ